MIKSLSEVIQVALDDSAFRQELLHDPDTALAMKEWELAPRDLEKLREFVSDEYFVVIDPKDLFKAFENLLKGRIPPPPIWQTLKKHLPNQ